jgi:hypothetical protein
MLRFQKIISPKNLAKILAFLPIGQTTASFPPKFDHNGGMFRKNANFFS